MSNILTSNKLISSIKRRAMIPSDQVTFENLDFLEMLNEEILYFGVQHLMSTYEEYLVTFQDFPLTANQVSKEFKIPSRAIGNKLRGLFYVDTSGDLYELARIALEDLPNYNNNAINFANGFSSAFYIQDNKVILVDEVPFSGGSLRMYFYLKPNKLVEEKRAGKITAIDTISGTITVDNFPANLSQLGKVDLVQADSPNKILKYDLTPTATSAPTKSLTLNPADLPSDLVIGDYLNFAGETIVPQFPTELHAILAQRVAVACLEALGDAQNLSLAKSRLEQMEKSTLSTLDNRVESANQKIKNNRSTLQQSVRGNYGVGRSGKIGG